MATNAQLLRKLAKGETLQESEITQLERALDGYDRAEKNVTGWLAGVGDPAEMTFRNARFLNSPSRSTTFTRPTDTSVANNTATYITFEAAYGGGFSLDDSDSTRVVMEWAGAMLLISGAATWATNGTGYRATQIELYDGAGALITTHTFHLTAPVATDITKDNFAVVLNSFLFPGIASIKMIVRQTSGGALDLTDFFVTFSLI